MEEAEFDKYVLAYEAQHRQNIAITGEDPAFFAEYKIKSFAQRHDRGVQKIIDFGAGIGNSIPFFRKHLPDAELTFSDISQRSLDYAAMRYPGPGIFLKIAKNGIPASDASFDAAFSACVFHHIAHDEHVFWLKELCRVVRPGGTLAIFEHNPLNPLTVRAVNTCPFDENAHLVMPVKLRSAFRQSGWQALKTRHHVFFPRFLSYMRHFEPLLSQVPFGGQYSILGRKPT